MLIKYAYLLIGALPLMGDGAATAEPKSDVERAILVFSKTAGFRHESIEVGVDMLKELGSDNGFTVAHSEDSAIFSECSLRRYAAVVFLSTTGDILDIQQQQELERYVKAGGSFIGIHAAADTEYDWPWYGRLLGARFENHPKIQSAVVVVEDPLHLSTHMLPSRWKRKDEWYNFRDNPRPHVHVLLTLDVSSYEGSNLPGDHPIAWCHEFDGGRSWYTGGGHTSESYAEPLFRNHILGGIFWAIGDSDASAGGMLNNLTAGGCPSSPSP